MIVRRIDVRVEKTVKLTSTGRDDVIGQTRECVLMVLYREHGAWAVGEESFAKGQGNVASLWKYQTDNWETDQKFEKHTQIALLLKV